MRKCATTFAGVTMAAVCLLAHLGCSDYSYTESAYTAKIEKGTVLRSLNIPRELEDRILALDPNNISEKDVREVLAKGPAPRIINIYGGVPTVAIEMVSFGKFLIGMGYPEGKIRDPKAGTYAYSCYDLSAIIAGDIAWYYEHEGMRPMLIGHSQGGIVVIKTLHDLSGTFGPSNRVRNPLTWKLEDRDWIIDPYTGQKRPVVGLQTSFASAVAAGGLTRFMPNQWSMLPHLRKVPDSCLEFTGFYMRADLLGSDWATLWATSQHKATGSAKVRTVLLPFGYDHYFVPKTAHLAKSKETRDWINSYRPVDQPSHPTNLKSSASNILWAADVWCSIKRHWCLEAQRLIRARRAMDGDTVEFQGIP